MFPSGRKPSLLLESRNITKLSSPSPLSCVLYKVAGQICLTDLLIVEGLHNTSVKTSNQTAEEK